MPDRNVLVVNEENALSGPGVELDDKPGAGVEGYEDEGEAEEDETPRISSIAVEFSSAMRFDFRKRARCLITVR